ncbi:ribbon-helix-helix domain-containing protein [Gulosibacter molinativorax]|uniref:hypothetical protein n=1 Tax=Gulosibacter molinativorax TaxID=256821 RepID=UPI0011B1E798|nr:hypothetical protein [Gulosibacter molinativorax]
MTDSSGAVGPTYRVLSVRMDEDTRAQLEVLAQLNERSVTEETRVALEHWVEIAKSDVAIHKRAEEVRLAIEREAEAKRNAISAIFGSEAKAHAKASPPTRSTGGKPAAN